MKSQYVVIANFRGRVEPLAVVLRCGPGLWTSKFGTMFSTRRKANAAIAPLVGRTFMVLAHHEVGH